MSPPIFKAILCLFLLLQSSELIAQTVNGYKNNQAIDVWANKIGPYNSPTESYSFYEKLKWCKSPKPAERPLRLGEAFSGDFFVKSPYELEFNVPKANTTLCEVLLSSADVDDFISAVRQRYIYELVLDDLPMKLFVGETSGEKEPAASLYTHISFTIQINGNRIVEASAIPAAPVQLLASQRMHVPFTYSVTWKMTDFPYSRRVEKYRDPFHAKDLEIHWFSIGNATLSVFLLMGMLGSIVTRVIRQDFKDCEALEGEEDVDEYGWKQLSGDVFRFPRALSILCPLLGTGIQLLILVSILLLLGALEMFHPLSRGTIYTATFCCYIATAGIAGFSSGYLYKQMGGTKWVKNALVTVVLFCGPAGLVAMYLHFLALCYNSTRALPVWTIAVIVVLWAGVTIPLTIFGAILGKNRSRPLHAPVRTNKIPREIPPCPWYRSRAALWVACGIIPFSSIYLEMHFLLSATWGHKVFEVYEMLGIVFIILIVVTLITSVSAVYFQLASENYLWIWSSVLYGGSVGFCIFVYSFFYYFIHSPLRGFLQASFFFGSMFLVSYVFFIVCGTAGFFASRRFVYFLYSNVKRD